MPGRDPPTTGAREHKRSFASPVSEGRVHRAERDYIHIVLEAERISQKQDYIGEQSVLEPDVL